MTIGHREAENIGRQLHNAFGSRVHDDIVVPLGDIDYFRMQYTYLAKSSTNFLLDVIFKQNELIADLRTRTRDIDNVSCVKHASDEVSHPDHYKMHNKECIVEMLILFGFDNFIDFCTMNAWKYRYRAGNKANNTAVQDNAKADRYIEYARRAAVIDDMCYNPDVITNDEFWSKRDSHECTCQVAR